MMREENQVMFVYRQQINDWLGPDGSERRRHLWLVANSTMWDLACKNFDFDFGKLTAAYDRSLDKLFAILTDDQQRGDIGDIGIVLEGWDDPSGEHLLWRHQFLMEACSLFCGTPRQKDVFEKIVQPLFQGLAFSWSDLRAGCKCATCQSMIKDKTTSNVQPLKDFLHYAGWKSKDLKLSTSTVLRGIDLFTKFAPNWAHVVATSPSSVAFRDIGIISWWFFIRAGVINPNTSTPKLAEQWMDLWADMAVAAKKGEGQLDNFVYKTLKFLHPNLTKKTTDILARVGDVFNLIGSAIVVYSVLSSDGKFKLKDAMDLSRAITDATKAGMGIGKQRLEAALTQYFVKKYGQELGVEAAKKWATALPKYVGVAGGMFQVASAFISLSDAADKGDSREFGWAAVAYTGADISMSGLVLDAMPEPLVTKGSGLVLNFIGGAVYLTGQLGEFITRPGAEEKFLRGHSFYTSDEHWKPGEREAYEREQEENMALVYQGAWDQLF
jgi:hypothetical protein